MIVFRSLNWLKELLTTCTTVAVDLYKHKWCQEKYYEKYSNNTQFKGFRNLWQEKVLLPQGCIKYMTNADQLLGFTECQRTLCKIC